MLPTRPQDHICFAIYSAGHAITRAYGPLLRELGLTYPQYITLMALWDRDAVPIRELSTRLTLDPSTLTPLLKRLEKLGHVTRKRSDEDERIVHITLTASGHALRAKSDAITRCIIADTGTDIAKLEQMVHDLTIIRDNMLSAKSIP